jgi:acetyl esterase/lipase
MSHKLQKSTKLPFYKNKKILWSVGVVAAVIFAVLLAFKVSPWPGALVIRAVFDNDSAKVKQALEKHTPSGVTKITNQQYRSGDADAFLDVYFPDTQTDTNNALPTIIWTHGGAWLSGDKANAEPYYKLIASKGFTVVSINYTLAPAQSYPAQLHQLNSAHAYVLANATRLRADTSRIFLAGDSAGSQLSAQLAAIITNPEYAKEVGLQPALNPAHLRGVLLNCGIYDMGGLTHPDPTLPKIVGWGDDVSVWAYSGTKDLNNPVIRQMSAYYHVTKDFPATFITGGNTDPLTDAQSKPFAAKLQQLNVPVTTLFYAKDHQPALPHEYQFNLDNQDGLLALHSMLTFVSSQAR